MRKKIFEDEQIEKKTVKLSSMKERKLIVPEVGNVSEGIASCDGYFDVKLKLPKGWNPDYKNKLLNFRAKTMQQTYTVDISEGIKLDRTNRKFKHTIEGWTVDVEVTFVKTPEEKRKMIDELTKSIENMKKIKEQMMEVKKKMDALEKKPVQVFQNFTYQ